MGEEKYEGLPDLIKELKEICSNLTEGIKEFGQGVKASREEISKKSFMARSFAKRDFESNTGMNFDEWIEFSEKLSERFKNITTALQRIEDNYKESKFEDIPESIERLEDASTPFLKRFDLINQGLDRFANYMLEMPKKVEAMPGPFKRFISEEDKKRMIEESPKAGELIKLLNETLETAKKLVTNIIENYQ